MTDRPLGVRADLPLTDAEHAVLRELVAVDLAPLRAALLRGALPGEWVDDAIVEFLRFLALHALSDRPPPMVCRAIEEVWRTCRVLSPKYARLCAVLGSVPQPDGMNRWRGYRAFAEAYARAFGPPTRMWKFPVLWWDPSCAHLFRTGPRPM